MGFLLFLPFLLKSRGAALTTVGLALSLVLSGVLSGKPSVAGSAHDLGVTYLMW
jgi:FSR family fosmidomycin resistance protein-like MFS transporter